MDSATLVATDWAWFVAHTRPRCEKKLVEFCGREGVPTTLPCIKNVRKYRGKAVEFENPLFPGYVFLQLESHARRKILQNDYCANLLNVPDQTEFQQQLDSILGALESDYEVRLCPSITPGHQVIIKTGPLRGLEGRVERRVGTVQVVLRLDFIGQAAAVTMEASELEPI